MDMELNTPSLEILDPGFMEAINRSVPAPFLIKTYQLVDDPATDHIVSWSDDDNNNSNAKSMNPEFL